jgi:hypothetical protein
MAGEPDDEIHDHPDYDELGHLIKPAPGTIAKGAATEPTATSEASTEPPAPTLKHG